MSTMTKLDFYPTEYRADSDGLPFHISTGGVVYRKADNDFEYLLLGRNTEEGVTYHLPKGTLHIDETLESCALREIAEESGCATILKTYLGAKTEQYTYNGDFDKTLHYYAAEYVAESEAMDNEHDFREWCQYDDAIAKLRTNIKREDIFIERTKKYLGSCNE